MCLKVFGLVKAPVRPEILLRLPADVLLQEAVELLHNLLDVHLGTGIGGKSFVVMTGEVAAVREAVAAGTKSARKEGLLIQEVVIPNPRPEIIDALL